MFTMVPVQVLDMAKASKQASFMDRQVTASKALVQPTAKVCMDSCEYKTRTEMSMKPKSALCLGVSMKQT